MQVILDSSFARPDSAPIWGGKKGEFRDWTRVCLIRDKPGGRVACVVDGSHRVGLGGAREICLPEG